MRSVLLKRAAPIEDDDIFKGMKTDKEYFEEDFLPILEDQDLNKFVDFVKRNDGWLANNISLMDHYQKILLAKLLNRRAAQFAKAGFHFSSLSASTLFNQDVPISDEYIKNSDPIAGAHRYNTNFFNDDHKAEMWKEKWKSFMTKEEFEKKALLALWGPPLPGGDGTKLPPVHQRDVDALFD